MSAVRALSFDDLHPRADALQREVSQYTPCDSTDVFHRSSLLRPKIRRESDAMSYRTSNRPFRERVRDALKARLHPKTNLHVKQFADAVQLSEATVWNLLSANNEPSGRTIDKLVEFFKDQFINEIWGCHNIVCLNRGDEKRADALRRKAEAEAELIAMEGR